MCDQRIVKMREQFREGLHFVVGDTHGCGKTLENLMKKIGFDEKKDHVYFLGDYYSGDEESDHVNLLQYLNQYYEPDVRMPGFHLLRGNHEWNVRGQSFLSDVWGNIKMSKVPDIIVTFVSGKKFVLCHAGMHKEIYDLIKEKGQGEYQLDFEWMKAQNAGRKYYKAIIFTPKEDFVDNVTYYDKSGIEKAEYWPVPESDTYFFHGHFPYTLAVEGGVEEHANYHYRMLGETGVQWNPLRHAINMDAGIKCHSVRNWPGKLACICLESFVDEYGACNKEAIFAESYSRGSAEIAWIPENRYVNKERKIIHINDVSGKLEIITGNGFEDMDLVERLKEVRRFIIEKVDDSEKVFIEDMYTVATADLVAVEDIDKSRDVIKAINGIIEYVKSNKSANPTVNDMFGFRESRFQTEVKGKSYYYFIADIKIKSMVYLLRIYNFVQSWERKSTVEAEKCQFWGELAGTRVNQIWKLVDKNAEKSQEWEEADELTFYELWEMWKKDGKPSFLYNRENESGTDAEIRKVICKIYELSECDQNSSKVEEIIDILERYIPEEEVQGEDITQLPSFQSYLNLLRCEKRTILNYKYYLFDNSMKEVDFAGIEWKWLWRYEQGNADLFRCVGNEDVFQYEGSYSLGKDFLGKDYYQNMIKNIVTHMNKGEKRVKLASYSKNPYRDIYKYMGFFEDDAIRIGGKEYYWTNQSGEWELAYGSVERQERLSLPYEEATTEVIFAMVKKANTNIMKEMVPMAPEKRDTEYYYRVGEKIGYSCRRNKIYSFSEFITEKNLNGEYGFCVDILNSNHFYRGDVRGVFGKYASQFPDIDVQEMQRNIVSPKDEEVIMLGNTSDDVVVLFQKDAGDSMGDVDYATCRENVEYRVKLNRTETLYLFYVMAGRHCKNLKVSNMRWKDTEEYRYYAVIDSQIPVCVYGMDAQQKPDEKKMSEELKAWICDYFETFEKENEQSRRKVEFIMSFIKQYKGARNYGNSMYKEKDGVKDSFWEFCKKLFLG